MNEKKHIEAVMTESDFKHIPGASKGKELKEAEKHLNLKNKSDWAVWDALPLTEQDKIEIIKSYLKDPEPWLNPKYSLEDSKTSLQKQPPSQDQLKEPQSLEQSHRD